MPRFQEPTFNPILISEIVDMAKKCKENDFAFVQLCATTRENSCELLYSFDDLNSQTPGLIGYTVDVPDGTHVPSITEFYPAAFVFENEIHDLFGIDVDGISIDFEGNLYTVAVAYPMNPRIAQKEDSEVNEEAQNE